MIPLLQTTPIAAGAFFGLNTGAKVLTIKTASLPVNVILNSGQGQLCGSGTVLPLPDDTSNQITFQNTQTVAITVSYWLADTAIAFSAPDSSTSNSPTRLFGNFGKVNGSSDGALPDDSAPGHNTVIPCSADGYFTIPNTPNLLISGTNNGNRRQIIIFSVKKTAAQGLNVMDVNKCNMVTINPGDPPFALPTDGDIYISGAAGSTLASIGQIFLNNS